MSMMPPENYTVDLDTLARRVVQGLDRRGQTLPSQTSTRINAQVLGVPQSNRHRALNFISAGIAVDANDTNHRADVAIPIGYLLTVIDGGGQAIAPSAKAQMTLHVHDNLTVVQWTLVADVVGSMTIDLKHAIWSAYPSTNSIISGTAPHLAGQQINKSIDYVDPTTGVVNVSWVPLNWTQLSVGDLLDVVVTASTGPTRATLILQCQGA